MVQKAIAFCGSTPENFAKVMMIENQLAKRGAQARHIADALKKLAGFDKRADQVEKIKKVIGEEKVKQKSAQSEYYYTWWCHFRMVCLFEQRGFWHF